MIELRYLTPKEEKYIKKNITWRDLDVNIMHFVKHINDTIQGIATVQSCAGHVKELKEGFHIEESVICFKATKKRTYQALFVLPQLVGIEDISIRYFKDGSFYIHVGCHPNEFIEKLQKYFIKMRQKGE